MATVTQCDRCKKQGTETLTVQRLMTFTKGCTSPELCTQCVYELEQFMENKTNG